MLEDDELVALRDLAAKAKPGDPMDRDLTTGDWEPWFNTHGDPYVVEKDRGQWATVATVATCPEDYGRARAQFIGTMSPNVVIEMIDELLDRRREHDDGFGA